MKMKGIKRLRESGELSGLRKLRLFEILSGLKGFMELKKLK